MSQIQRNRLADVPGVPVSMIPESQRICKSCGAGGMRVFYEVRGIPVHSCMLLPTRAEALAFPRGDLALGFLLALRLHFKSAIRRATAELRPGLRGAAVFF